MTPEEQKALADTLGAQTKTAIEKEAAAIKNDFAAQIEKMKTEGATKADFEALEEKYKEQQEILVKQADLMTQMKNMAHAGDPSKAIVKHFEEALDAKFKSNELETAISKGGSVKIDFKSATIMSTSNFASGVVRGLRMPEVEKIDKNPYFILNLINVFFGGPGSNPFSWVELQKKEGAPTTVAESGTKPYVDYNWVKNEANAKTIAGVVAMTKQQMLNMPSVMNAVRTELMEEVQLVLQNQIIFGDNTGENLKGIVEYAASFDAGALASSVSTPTEVDVLRAAIAQVYREKGSATACLIHPDKAAMMDLTKGTDGHYTMPPFVSASGLVIKGVPVYEAFEFEGHSLTSDGFIVGPFNKSNLNIVEDLVVEIGWVNDMFLKNQMAVRAELFAAHGIKAQHASKFVKGTFASAITDLTKI